MTRGHRIVHRMLWPVLAAIVALGIAMALVLRPPPEQPDSPPATHGASETRVNALMSEPAK